MKRPSPPREGIRQRGRQPTDHDLANIESAIQAIGQAAHMLALAGAHHAADYARRAQKSAFGARNHVLGRLT